MEIKQKLCNKANYGGKRGKISYIVIHYTSNKGDTANNNVTYFAREVLKRPASAHYFVDEKEIWLSVPEDMTAYHCGGTKYFHKTCRNKNSLGIEICMNDKNGAVRMASIENAAKLVRYLMQKHDIGIENILRHHDITGKNCPAPMVENINLWYDFLNMLVDEEESEVKIYQYVKDMPDWAQSSVTKAIKNGIVAMNEQGAVGIYEPNLQTLVWMDRAGMMDKDTIDI